MASLAAIATAVGVGACGGSSGPPAGDVAVVGAAPITLAQFHHWELLANNSPYVNTHETPPALPVPPKYTACIASERPRQAKGTSTSQLKVICQTDYTSQILPDSLNLLIQADWIQGEAVDEHVKVSNSAVVKAFDLQKKQDWPTAKDFDDFLGASGYTLQDLEYVQRLELLEEAIVKKVESAGAKVTPADIAGYYKSHIAQYTEPERRNVELVLAKNAASAAAVHALLAGGASFASVVKKYSIDPTTKANGGVADGIEQGEETPAFSSAIFAAPIGKLQAPVKTAFGYYVFEVTESLHKFIEPFKTVEPTIKESLTEQGDNGALTNLRNTFAKKWKARTKCASAYLVAATCSNAPASSSTGSSGSS